MPGKVIVSASAIQGVERQIAAHDRKIAFHGQEREKLVVKLNAMRTLLPTTNGHRPSRAAKAPPEHVPTAAPAADAPNVPDVFRVAMRKHGAAGLKPKEIRAVLLREGVKATQLGSTGNYLYSVIARALKRGEIVLGKDGRYRPMPQLPFEDIDTAKS